MSLKKHLIFGCRWLKGLIASIINRFIMEREGLNCPKLDNNGATCNDPCNCLDIINEYRELYDECLCRIEGRKGDMVPKSDIAEMKQLGEDLWEQNTMLVDAVKELEAQAIRQVSAMEEKLNKACEQVPELASGLVLDSKAEQARYECNLQKKEECIRRLNEMQREAKQMNKNVKRKLKQLKDAVTGCRCRSEQQPPSKDAGHRQLDCDDDAELDALVDTLRAVVAAEMDALGAENASLMKEVALLKTVALENEQLSRSVCELKAERQQLAERNKEADNSFRETRWALTAEVAEKHDQIVELRKSVAALEEQLRQADMQTHFKDDIIKELRKELKTAKKQDPKDLFDVVTELKAVGRNDSVGNMSEVDCRGETPQEKLRHLQRTLKKRIEEIEIQEHMSKELERDLNETRRELTVLQEKYDRSTTAMGPKVLPDEDSCCCGSVDPCILQQWSRTAAQQLQLLDAMERQAESGMLSQDTRTCFLDAQDRLRCLLERAGTLDCRTSLKQDSTSSLLREEKCVQADSGGARMLREKLDSFHAGLAGVLGCRSSLGDKMMDEESLSEELDHLQLAILNSCEDVSLLKEKVQQQDIMIQNKEDTLSELYDTLCMKDRQAEASGEKLCELEAEVIALTKLIEEKSQAIVELQRHQKQAEFQVEVRDEQVESLQFEVCDLERRLNYATKEVGHGARAAEALMDENVDLRADIFVMQQDACMQENQLRKYREQAQIAEELVSQLEDGLEQRDEEITKLRQKIKCMEIQHEDELCAWQEQAREDSTAISALHRKLEAFRAEVCSMKDSFDVSIAEAEQQILNERLCGTEKIKQLEEKLIKREGEQKETLKKTLVLEQLLRESEQQRAACSAQVAELQKTSQQRERQSEEEKIKWLIDSETTARKILKLKTTIAKLKQSPKKCSETEVEQKRYIEGLTRELVAMQKEREQLKAVVEDRTEQLTQLEKDAINMQRCISKLQEQKDELKSEAKDAMSELEVKNCLGEKLNQMLEEQALEITKANKKQQVTNRKLQESLQQIKNMACELESVRREVVKDEELLEEMKRINETQALNNCGLLQQLDALQVELDEMRRGVCAKEASWHQSLVQEVEAARERYDNLAADHQRLKEDLCQSAEREARLETELTRKDAEYGCSAREVSLQLGAIEELELRLAEMNKDLEETRREKEKVTAALEELTVELKCSSGVKTKYEKMLAEVNAKKRDLQEHVGRLEEQLSRQQHEIMMLSQQNDSENRTANEERECLVAENTRVVTQNKQLIINFKDVSAKLQSVETLLVPELEQKLAVKMQELEEVRAQLDEANTSCSRMRTEAETVISNSKKCLATHKAAADNLKCHVKVLAEEKNVLVSDIRELEERLKELACMNEYLLTEADRQHCQPQRFTHGLCTSPDMESGFHSQQASPDMFEFQSNWRTNDAGIESDV